jgi:hypothetical protein
MKILKEGVSGKDAAFHVNYNGLQAAQKRSCPDFS